MHIIFTTGNTGKIKTAERYLNPLGVTVEGRDLDLIEPQSNSLAEIAASKAEQAFKKLGQPVMVQDSGFFIPALNGFPGPYAKYAIETIGAAGIMNLMSDKTDRSCYFQGVIAYVDQNAKTHIFDMNTGSGIIAAKASTVPLRPDAWSELWKVYIPEGLNKTLNDTTKEELDHWYATRTDRSYFDLFADWIKSQDHTSNTPTIHKLKR